MTRKGEKAQTQWPTNKGALKQVTKVTKGSAATGCCGLSQSTLCFTLKTSKLMILMFDSPYLCTVIRYILFHDKLIDVTCENA
jgi:hypothetical protein